MCSPDEICKKDKREDVVTHAETVSLEKGIHSYFEILLNYVTFFVPNAGFIMSCVPLIPVGFFLVAFKKAPL